MELGPVTEKNFNNLSEILKATVPVTYDAEFFSSLDRGLCQFAYLSDFLVGAVACRRQSEIFYVLALATLAPYRRRGVASALLVWAEARAKHLGCSEISLHVRASDADSQNFYLGRGFVQRERLAQYYPMPGDSEALHLVKKI